VTEEPASAVDGAKPAEGTLPAAPGASVPVEDEAGRREQQKAARKEEKRKAREEEHPDRIRRDIEIGLERFQAAGDGFIDAIADTVYRTVLSVDDISKRQDAWDALVICGSGSKVRGFKDALITTLNNHYLVSPSSATMFMSELPSNLATPSGTGSMTPNASFSSTPHQPPTASAVNPLLLAATTASNPALNPNLSIASYNSHQTHSSHSQSPTSIKVASPPTYFPEWKTYEEAVFLGSQIAAKVIFVNDQGLSKGFLSRVEFNEDGPSAIHQV
jgi:actin-related protein 9